MQIKLLEKGKDYAYRAYGRENLQRPSQHCDRVTVLDPVATVTRKAPFRAEVSEKRVLCRVVESHNTRSWNALQPGNEFHCESRQIVMPWEDYVKVRAEIEAEEARIKAASIAWNRKLAPLYARAEALGWDPKATNEATGVLILRVTPEQAEALLLCSGYPPVSDEQIEAAFKKIDRGW